MTGAPVLVEALLGVDQLVARDHHAALDRDGRRPRPSAAPGCPAGRGPAQLARVGGEVDQLEFEPRGLADQMLQRLGILDARNLDEDAVAALVDDRDFLGPVRIDAAADDVARDGHRILQRLRGAARRRGQDDPRRIDHRTSQSRVPVSADRLGQGAHALDRRVELVGSRTMNDSRPPAGRNVADLDARVAAKLGRDLSSIACKRCLARRRHRLRAADGCRRRGRDQG